MLDLFRWRLDPYNSERLYFYSTLLRLVYANDAALWTELANGIDQIVEIRSFPVVNEFITSFACVKGRTGTVVVFEGTTNWWQMGSQAANYGQTGSEFFPGNFSVHDSNLTLQLEANAYNYLVANAPEHITFIGHSLGGAIAQLMAHRIARFLPNRIEGVITFGSKKVGDEIYAAANAWPVNRVENIGDLVPILTPPDIVWSFAADFGVQDPWVNLLSIVRYQPAGNGWLLSEDGNITTLTNDGMVTGSFSVPLDAIPTPQTTAWVWQHRTSEYVRRLRTRLGRLTPLSALAIIPTRATLDKLNQELNTRDGIVWNWDPFTGLPVSSVINPNLPAPICGCGR